jgi:hypothetical protein
MIAANVNKTWAMSVTFAQFCKDSNIKKLKPSEQKKLYENVTGKKLKKKEGEG